nr:MAG TPA: Sigma factor regulator N-terminal [Caudoviricetes sp.]
MNDLDVLSEVKKIMDEKNATSFNVKDVQEATKRIKRKEILRILWIVSISVAVSLITVYMM